MIVETTEDGENFSTSSTVQKRVSIVERRVSDVEVRLALVEHRLSTRDKLDKSVDSFINEFRSKMGELGSHISSLSAQSKVTWALLFAVVSALIGIALSLLIK